MIVLIIGIIILILLSVGLIYPVLHIISILDIPHYMLTIFDYLNWFIACVIIILIILDVMFILDDLGYSI